MIGRLVSKNVRTVYNKKVVRLTVDLPFDRVEAQEMNDSEMLRWLDKRVDSEVGFDITTLEDQEQDVIMEDHEKV